MGNKMEKDEQVYFTYETETIRGKIDRESFGTETKEVKLKNKNSGVQKRFVIGLIAVALIAIISVVIVEIVKRKDNTIKITEENVFVKCFELAGDETIYANVDYEYVYEKAKEIFSKRPEAKDDPEYVEVNAMELLEAFSVEVKDENDIYIGDIAIVTVNINKKILEEKGVYCNGGRFKIKVEGYVIENEDTEPINIWSDVRVYEVNLGDIIQYRAYLNGLEHIYLDPSDFEYIVEKIDSEKIVRIKITDECKSLYYWSEVAFEPTEHIYTEKEIVRKTVYDYDGLNEKMISKLDKTISDKIKMLYSEYNEALVVDSVEYYGGWVANYGTEDVINKFVRVYKIQVSHKEELFEPMVLYVKYEMVNAAVDLEKNEVSIVESRISIDPFVDNLKTLLIMGEDKVSVAGCEDIDRVLRRERVPSGNGSVVFDVNGNIEFFLE